MNANLVTSPLPLPTHEQPNDNVLATVTPSKAPALPSQKTERMEDLNAIPIQGKKVKPKKETVRKTPQHAPTLERPNVAAYGEQSGSNMQRSIQQQGFSGQTAIQNGNFGTQFPWYVQLVINKMGQSWYRSAVNPSTPAGSRAYITFVVNRDGTITNPRLLQSSGSSTMDYSCVAAAERAQVIAPLPSAYSGSTIQVTYYCLY